jgi:hypothetical protein
VAENLFILQLAICCALYLRWGAKALTGESWQFIAAIPIAQGNGQWQGLNLTWYGALTANAYVVAVLIIFILLGAAGTPLAGTFLMVIALLALCVPASRVIARIVEGKAHTFTVGGASFVGVVAAPWVVLLVNQSAGMVLGFQIPVMAALAAGSIAYAFGEGLGRLACISFGCCYGKPLSSCNPLVAKVFAGYSFVFTGKTKKIAYASGLDGVKILPVQAFTYILYTCAGLVATWLFLHAFFIAAFLLATTVTQGWRVLSELLREDYRGNGTISAYQILGTIAIVYAYGTAFVLAGLGVPQASASLVNGLTTLWNPAMILFIQALWLVIFIYTGCSKVTGSTLSFHVHHDQI